MHTTQSQSEALKHELKIRFEKKPRKCRKINDSYIGYAQRIVCTNENMFYYYPMIQQFKDLDFDKLQYVIPKAGVRLQDITQLKFPPRRTNERNYFSITLPKNKILKFTKTMKSIVVDEYAQGEQTWTFNFNYDIISLPEREQKQKTTLHKEYLKQKQREQQVRKLKQEQERQAKQKMVQQYNSLLQAESMKIQEGQQYKRKRQQALQKENRQKMINECDELFFTRVYQRMCSLIQRMQTQKDLGILKTEKEDITTLAKLEIQLLKTVGNFRLRAENTVKQFVDEWPYTNQKIVKNKYYRVNNMFIKVGDKNLNQQFLSNTWTANSIYKIFTQLSKPLRVPLIALVKYKGFKLLARAWTPADQLDKRDLDQAIVHGNCSDNWKSSFLIMDSLSTIADNLKLKPYNSEVHYQRVQIHLGTSLKVIETQKDPFASIKQLDPQKLSEALNDYRLYYLYDIDEVFPIDLDLQENVNQSCIRLRPQFVDSYKDPEVQKTRLVGGSLLYSIQDEEGQKEDVVVAKAAQHFKFVTLFNFVKSLDKLDFIPYDSQSYGKILKQHGVNARYMGTIFKSTSLPYIKSMTEVQCIARIIKTIYRQFQQQFCQSVFKSDNQVILLVKQAFSPQTTLSLKKLRLKELKKLQSQKSISNAIDYLNLIFSSTHETFQFWKIIKEKVKNYYAIEIGEYMSLPHGHLLKAVLYHCSFQVKITQKTALFLSQKPFADQDWIRFITKVQSFDFPAMNVYTKTDQKLQYTDEVNKNHLQMDLLIKRSLKKPQLDVLIKLTKYRANFLPPRQFYSIENLFYYFIHPTPENFDNALKVAHTILPSSHPFFIEMYLRYSELKTSKLDIVSLKKAAQSHATRNLGLTHWKTAQILSNFNQVQYLNHLKKAQIGVAPQQQSKLYLEIVKQEAHLGRLVECSGYVRKSIELFGTSNKILKEQQIQHYFQILLVGMQANYKMRRIQNLVKISEYMWLALQKYWNIKYLHWFKKLMQMVMKCFLESYEKKLYMYKLVIVLKDQINHEVQQEQLDKILLEIFYKCKESKNHLNWIKELFINLEFGYLELNFRNDFFTNFWKHTKTLANQDLEEGLKYIHELLHILGEEYFQLALLDRIYSFEKGFQFNGNDNMSMKEKLVKEKAK